MAAANTDKFRKVAANTGWQVGGGGVSDAVVTTIPLVSSNGIPTDTGVTITIDRVDSSGTKTPSKMERITGVVSGNNIINCVRGVEGTAQAHAAGAVVEIVFSAVNFNDMMSALINGHAQDGSHSGPTISIPAHAASVKTSPVAADEFPIMDSAASYALAKLTLGKLMVALQLGQSYTPAGGATATLDLSLGTRHSITMPAGNITIALSNATIGQRFIVDITQDGVGSRTVTWFTTIRWDGGSAPTLSTTASKRDVFGFICTGTGTYDGFVIGQNI